MKLSNLFKRVFSRKKRMRRNKTKNIKKRKTKNRMKGG